MPGNLEEFATATILKQSAEQHEQAMRANALNCAALLLAADSPEVSKILTESEHLNLTGTRQLELLANHLLTFIETGSFLVHDRD